MVLCGRSRCWFGTLNNYTEADSRELEALFELEADWAICANEGADEDRTPHKQFAVRFKSARTFEQVITVPNQLPTARSRVVCHVY